MGCDWTKTNTSVLQMYADIKKSVVATSRSDFILFEFQNSMQLAEIIMAGRLIS